MYLCIYYSIKTVYVVSHLVLYFSGSTHKKIDSVIMLRVKISTFQLCSFFFRDNHHWWCNLLLSELVFRLKFVDSQSKKVGVCHTTVNNYENIQKNADYMHCPTAVHFVEYIKKNLHLIRRRILDTWPPRHTFSRDIDNVVLVFTLKLLHLFLMSKHIFIREHTLLQADEARIARLLCNLRHRYRYTIE